MKGFILLIGGILFLLLSTLALAGDVSVRGHWRDSDHDGIKDKYVDHYHRSSPNKSLRDNYGYPGNFNPNTRDFSTGNPETYERSQKHNNSLRW